MRKVILALAIAFCLALTFVFGASAHTAQAAQRIQIIQRPLHSHKVTPHASGGGCSSKRTNKQGDISVSACISYQNPQILSDSYVTFRPLSGHGGVSSCTITIYTWDTNTGSLDKQETFNCSVAASLGETNAHFGPTSFNAFGVGGFYCYAIVKIVYSDSTYTTGLSPDSPIQYIP